jgi:hypothetical protein
MRTGFLSDAHRAAFEAARDEVRYGGRGQVVCGSRLRGGGACKAPPVSGFSRCIKHGGPPVARAVRNRQLAALARGELDPAAFDRAEARRAANRLQDQWKRNPWLPGQTLNLGTHEAAFVAALGEAGFCVGQLAPMLLDRARWRFRRLLIDRRRPDDWNAFMVGRFTDLVASTARQPGEATGSSGLAPAPFQTPSDLSPYSRRRRLDEERLGHIKQPAKKTRPAAVPLPDDAVAEVLWRHRVELAPVVSLCRSDEDRRWVAATFVKVQRSMGDAGAHRDWLDLVIALRRS